MLWDASFLLFWCFKDYQYQLYTNFESHCGNIVIANCMISCTLYIYFWQSTLLAM